MKLILHIGHSKCGSSSIQSFLSRNIAALEVQNIGYLDEEFNVNHIEKPTGSLVGFFVKLRNGLVTPQDFYEKLLRAYETATSRGIQALVLSAENLSDIHQPKYFQSVAGIFDMQIIYYIRRQDDWLVSSWKQWQMKEGLKLEEFINKRLSQGRFMYKRVLNAWEAVVPREKIYVNMMDRSALYEGNLLLDFCRAIDVNAEQMEQGENRNVSLGYGVIDILRQHNHIFNSKHDNDLLEILEAKYSSSFSPREAAISSKTRREIMDLFKEENDWLSQAYFKGRGFESLISVEEGIGVEVQDELSALHDLVDFLLKEVIK